MAEDSILLRMTIHCAHCSSVPIVMRRKFSILGIAKSYRQQGFDAYADDLELTCHNQCLAVYGPDHPFMKLCEEEF